MEALEFLYPVTCSWRSRPFNICFLICSLYVKSIYAFVAIVCLVFGRTVEDLSYSSYEI
jgi:hypothetical protein